MIRAVGRSPLAAAATRCGSAWWRLPAPPTQRWLTTPPATAEDPVAQARAKRREERNARHFALLPLFVEKYRANVGHYIVPNQFVLPRAEGAGPPDRLSRLPTRMVGRESDIGAISWPADMLGLNLRRVLHRFASNTVYQAEHPEVTSALWRMGFPLNDAYLKLRWDRQTMAALKTFHRIHGHTNVPSDFIVPRGDAEWPVATWGYRLGARVERLRQEVDKLVVSQLNDLDSVLLPPGEGKSRWVDGLQDRPRVEEAAIEKLTVLKEKPQAPHENARSDPVPRPSPWNFKVPVKETSQAPQKEKSEIPLKKKPPAPRRKPWVFEDSEHFADHEVETENQWTEFVLPSLEVFHQVKGHSIVALDFVVPSNSSWPTNAWGLKLGMCVDRMRSRGNYATQIKRDAARLSALDFALDVNEFTWNQKVLPALTVFAEQHGHSDVPRSFVVPSDTSWPHKSWGLPLGDCMDELSTRERFFVQAERDAAQLEAIGFVRKPSEYRWSHVILPALETFFSTFGHCDVTVPFVVPSSSPWPEEAWGLQLGYCVKHIWSSGAFAVYVERDAARLREIEFVERSTDYKWDNMVLPALKAFVDEFKHCRVPRSFIVPSESPWPAKAWGWRLGRVVESIRRTNNYHVQVQRDASQLDAIGFYSGGAYRKGYKSAGNRLGKNDGKKSG